MDLRERAKPDPQSREEVQRWALVGAYERDNMGDFLLLRATELLLARPGRNLVRTAPFTPAPGVMAPERVVRWSDELSARPAAVVWTVGGAVGAVSPQRAWSMSAPPAAWSSFRAMSGRACSRTFSGPTRPSIRSPTPPTPGPSSAGRGQCAS